MKANHNPPPQGDCDQKGERGEGEGYSSHLPEGHYEDCLALW